jgi:hypothetical protein
LKEFGPDAFTFKDLERYEWELTFSGGTTGVPVPFNLLKKRSSKIFLAQKLYAWKASGYTPKQRALDLTWVIPGREAHLNPYLNWMSISISSLNKYSFNEYINKIEEAIKSKKYFETEEDILNYCRSKDEYVAMVKIMRQTWKNVEYFDEKSATDVEVFQMQLSFSVKRVQSFQLVPTTAKVTELQALNLTVWYSN